MRYAVCYDVIDDKRRLRIARILTDYGQRVQYSVFEAEMTKGTFDRMTERLAQNTDKKRDSIIIYRLCATCTEAAMVIGVDNRLRPQDAIVV